MDYTTTNRPISLYQLTEIHIAAQEKLSTYQPEHGYSHAMDVLQIACGIARKTGADVHITSVTALLHDIDDYKLVPEDQAKNLMNTREILNHAAVRENIQEQILKNVSQIGYSKRLSGIIPESPEAKAVSDADMLTLLGASGFLRMWDYSKSENVPFFDPNIWPTEHKDKDNYIKSRSQSTSVCHIFEKALKLKDLMLTDPGREEARKRHLATLTILHAWLTEQGYEHWADYVETAYPEFRKPELLNKPSHCIPLTYPV